MKWNELRRIAEEKGWYSWRKGGNHDIYRHPDKDEFLYIERTRIARNKTWLIL